MSQIKRICDFLFHANVIKTIIFNFRMLPKQQAIRLPIWLYGRVDIGECTGGGKIVFSSQQKPHFGGWKIGRGVCFCSNLQGCLTTILNIQGRLELGERGMVLNGSIIKVCQGAVLELGSDVVISSFCKIYCMKKIIIGDTVRISWESQIFDTNFHYFISNNKIVHRMCQAVLIGTKCWIGNRVTINKGSILPECSIVASNSLVNKDFSKTPNSIFGGCPAKYISGCSERIFSSLISDQIWAYFANHANEEVMNVDVLDKMSNLV